MLIIKKYVLFILGGALLLFVLILFDMQRQQKLAESYADVNLRKIVATSATLQKWALPSTLLNTNIKRVDTNYTFTQWQVVFSVDDNSFVQVFVKPTNFIGIPILNFEKDFLIDHISYEK